MEKKKSTKQKGAEAEKVAAKYYEGRGAKVVARNFRIHNVGELDLVLEEAGTGTIVFVEVKGRREFREDEGGSRRWQLKKLRIRRTAHHFLQRHRLLFGMHCDQVRLDIVYVTQGRVTEVYEDEPFV